LIKCGAFDSLDKNRAALLSKYESVLNRASKYIKGQTTLFGDIQDIYENEESNDLPVEDFSKEQMLRMEKEMNLNEYLLLQEAVSTTALEREMTEEEVIAVHDSIMNKLWGTND
jgi:DNA polymerase III alpha subunit